MGKNWGIIIHAGAGPDSEFIKEHHDQILIGLEEARDKGYRVLEKKGSALDAVEAAVRCMEDNLLFNAGRGSALNKDGVVEMCSSIMDGRELRAGAAAVIKGIKNPVSFARKILEDGKCVYVAGENACVNLGSDQEHMPDSYFITDHQVDSYLRQKEKSLKNGEPFNPAMHGTVGAVAIDHKGNLAAATSTGGTSFSLPGRIGDSSMIGIGTYADNKHCAVSCTGDGEYLIRHAVAHAVTAAVEYLELDAARAVEELVHRKLKNISGDVGVICIDKNGHFGIAFNSQRMHRSWKSSGTGGGTAIYP